MSESTGSGSRYAEAVLLGLLVHELVAGVVLWAVGLPGAAAFLWVVGTGFAVGYALVWLVWQLRVPRHRVRVAMAVAVLAALIAAIVVEAFVVSDALGVVLIAGVFVIDYRSDLGDRGPRSSVFPRLDGVREVVGRSRRRTGG